MAATRSIVCAEVNAMSVSRILVVLALVLTVLAIAGVAVGPFPTLAVAVLLLCIAHLV